MHSRFYSYLVTVYKLQLHTRALKKKSKSICPSDILIRRYKKIYHKRKIKQFKKYLNEEIFSNKIKTSDKSLNDQFQEDLIEIQRKKKKKPKKSFDNIFSAEENYGSRIYPYFITSYINLSYLEILQSLLNLDLSNLLTYSYEDYFLLVHLKKYLKRFICRAYPKYKRKIKKFSYLNNELELQNFEEELDLPFLSKKTFCLFCHIEISLNVILYHIKGKKHIKNKEKYLISKNNIHQAPNIKCMKETNQSENVSTQEIDKQQNIVINKYFKLKKSSFITFYCAKIHIRTSYEYLQISKSEFMGIMKEICFLLVFVEKEHLLAISTISDKINTDNVTPIKSKTNNLKILPTWLIKLKGLKVPYNCDVCQKIFKGRNSFDNHFENEFHRHKLIEMGITHKFDMFRGIAEKANVMKMWSKIQNNDS